MVAKSKLHRLIIYLGLIALAIYSVFPIYWIGVTSFKSLNEIVNPIPTFIPLNPTIENYVKLFAEEYNFHIYIVNSLIVGIGVVLITTLLSAFAGYGLARIKAKGSRAISNLLLFSYVTPPAVLLVPFYVIVSYLKLINTLGSLILVYPVFTIPFATWLLRSFFAQFPTELEEAAMVDGLGRIGVLRHIVLPLSLPALAVIVAYSLIWSWTEYMFAFTFIRTEELKTVPVALAHSITVYHVDWGLLNAGAFISVLPVLVIFLPMARYMIKGLVVGAVKG
jgi:multiple sugar transport system permease protein